MNCQPEHLRPGKRLRNIESQASVQGCHGSTCASNMDFLAIGVIKKGIEPTVIVVSPDHLVSWINCEWK